LCARTLDHTHRLERACDPEWLRVSAKRAKRVGNRCGGGVELPLVQLDSPEDLQRDPELAPQTVRPGDAHGLFGDRTRGGEIALPDEERRENYHGEPLPVEIARFLKACERSTRRSLGRHQPFLA
jgi:hypothetical protein